MYAQPLYTTSFERCKEVEYWNVCCFILLRASQLFPSTPFLYFFVFLSHFFFLTFSFICPNNCRVKGLVYRSYDCLGFILYSRPFLSSLGFFPLRLAIYACISRYLWLCKVSIYIDVFFLLITNYCKISVKFINALMKFLSREFMIFLFNIVSSL